MKKMRKLTAFVIALVLVWSSLVMPAYAEFTLEQKQYASEIFNNFINVDPEIFLYPEESIINNYKSASLIFSEPMTDEELEYVKQLTRDIAKDCTSDEQEIYAVMKHLATNICYDYDNFLNDTGFLANINPYDVLVKETAVCEGYAIAFATMMQVLENPCVVVYSPDHAWNMVYNGEEWMLVDVTWICGSTMKNGVKRKSSNLNLQWYDFSLDQALGEEHHTFTALDYMEVNGVLEQFPEYTKCTKFEIPDTVTEIDYGAFMGCGSLKEIVIPESVTKIGNMAFRYCAGLETITIPGTVETLGSYLLTYCSSLKTVIIEEGVTALPVAMFEGSSEIESVWIPRSVTSIGAAVFAGSVNLKTIYYGGSEEEWQAISVGEHNWPLNNITIVYNCSSEGTEAEPTPEPEVDTTPVTALVTDQKLEMNGEQIDIGIFNIGDKNYFKLRDIAALVNGSGKQFSVGWDGERSVISLTTGEAYKVLESDLQSGGGVNKDAIRSTATVVLNGKVITLTAYNIEGNTYYQLRELCKALDIAVTWNEATRTMGIDPTRSYE